MEPCQRAAGLKDIRNDQTIEIEVLFGIVGDQHDLLKCIAEKPIKKIDDPAAVNALEGLVFSGKPGIPPSCQDHAGAGDFHKNPFLAVFCRYSSILLPS